MKQFEITPSVKYVGADDTDLDLFEGQYPIPNGVSYNSYIIDDEKIALLDTVDARKTDEWLNNVDAILNGRQIDYLIISHMEPDHASNIQTILEKFPNCVAVCTVKAAAMIPQFFTIDISDRLKIVKEKDTLELGSHTLQFFMAPMVHWPEVMVSYEISEKILFSADGFGKFGALSCNEDWTEEARRYYFNICGKYGTPVQGLLKKASTLDIKIICPLHGPILKENLGFYIGKYDTWSKYEAEEKGILIAYCSLHGNTESAALKLEEILKEKDNGLKVETIDLRRTDMSVSVEKAFKYDRLIVAAPTYDAGVMPIMSDFLHHLNIKAYQKRKVAIIENGSWAPAAAKKMREAFECMCNIEIAEPVVSIKSTLKPETIDQLEELAVAMI